MSNCTCNLPKYTSAEREALASFTTGAQVVAFHRARHAGTTIVRNSFEDLLVAGKVERGVRIELSCGAAIGLPFSRFGR
ncbi:hypothetical protein SEA_GARDENB_53 [Microbacterium phage GardenB]|nr:hypothetical protein SEA_GARDENB_53 [Microbacterium phage GardenB]